MDGHLKNGILLKIKGACSSFFQKYQLPNITWCLSEKYFFSQIWGARAPLPPPVSYAYGVPNILELFLTTMLAAITVITNVCDDAQNLKKYAQILGAGCTTFSSFPLSLPPLEARRSGECWGVRDSGLSTIADLSQATASRAVWRDICNVAGVDVDASTV